MHYFNTKRELTRKELEAASMASLGLTDEESAVKLHVSKASFTKALSRVRFKTEQPNTKGAIRVLVEQGLIGIALAFAMLSQIPSAEGPRSSVRTRVQTRYEQWV